MMPMPFNFRSAFNGFNREDVVQYIEYLNANHSNQIKQLQADLAAAQKDSLLQEPAADQVDLVAQMQEQFAQQEAVLTALNAEKDDLLAKCAQLEAVLAALTSENQTISEKAAKLEAQLTSSAEQSTAAETGMIPLISEELAAYRRAERVEREAKERASIIYRNLCTALQDTAVKTAQAVSNMDSISDQFNVQLTALKDALYDSKAFLDQSLVSLDEVSASAADE